MSEGFTRATGSDPAAFRNCFGRFATGVLVATCHPPGGAPLGITVNSLSSVSLDPALALFCLEERSATLAGFLSAGHFALNFLAEGQEAFSNRFAREHAISETDGTAKWKTGAPVLESAMAVADCSLQDVYGGGDHRILLGRVEEVGWRDDIKPLLYYRGSYGRIGDAPV